MTHICHNISQNPLLITELHTLIYSPIGYKNPFLRFKKLQTTYLNSLERGLTELFFYFLPQRLPQRLKIGGKK